MQLFMDDDIKRWELFAETVATDDRVWAYDAATAIGLLKSKQFSVIRLDHDLEGKIYQSSDDPTSGMEVVRYMVANRPSKKAKVIVHSFNHVVAEVMVAHLIDAGYRAVYEPFNLPRARRIDD